MRQLSAQWDGSARVRQPDRTMGLAFEPAKDDFLENLLPFHRHRRWQALPTADSKKVLSYGWQLYNEKTIEIEAQIITPVCIHLLSTTLPTSHAAHVREAAAEVLTDESFHTLMCVRACRWVKEHRELDEPKPAPFRICEALEHLLGRCSAEWERHVVRLGFACASETLITDYLSQISESDDIQPFCRETVLAHASDEWSHSSTFCYLLACIYPGLSTRGRALVWSAIHHGIEAFRDRELDAWAVRLDVCGIAGAHGMLRDVANDSSARIAADDAGVDRMMSILEITRGDVTALVRGTSLPFDAPELHDA